MEMEHGKLFIGGISWDTNEDRLKEYFETFGGVVEAVIMKDRTTGRARGFGFVVFADPAIAERVVKENHMIDGRTVEAKKAIPRDDQQTPNRSSGSIQGLPGPARTKKIFVGGLASTVTESDFKKYFDQFGTITDVVVMYDHNTQRPRGFGFITFDSEEAVERVLLRTFHQLNGKMVEVKRAVPKELSSGTVRNQLSGHNHGLNRVFSLFSAYTQGYNPSSVGGYGVRLDGRFSPVTVDRSGYPPFSPSGYGMGPNFEPGLGTHFEEAGHVLSSLSYGCGLNRLQNGSPNRYGSPIGYGISSGGNGYVSSSSRRNTWENGSFGYAKSPTNSGDFIGSGSGNIGAIWGSSSISGQDGGTASAFSSGNISYGSAGSNFELGGGVYAGNTRSNFELGGGVYAGNTRSNVAPTSSYAAENSGHDGAYGNFYGGGLFYGDPTWRSSSPELEGSGSFGYGLRNAVSDVRPRSTVDFVGGYSVTNRSNGGIAA